MKHLNYTKNFWRLFLLVIAVIFPLFLLPEIATAGVIDFFVRMLIGVGKWVSVTVVGGSIENSIDQLVSLLNSDMIKPDYWGSLTGSGPSKVFDGVLDGRFFKCATPNPTFYHRNSVNSAWELEELSKNFLEKCFSALSTR
jgi:hypothetical protein